MGQKISRSRLTKKGVRYDVGRGRKWGFIFGIRLKDELA